MLTLQDIEPGVVVWLDSDALNADSRASATGAVGVRPFVCVDVGPGTTTWLALTTKDRPHHDAKFRRFPIPAGAKFNGPPVWRTQPNYIRDMACPVVARDTVILAASRDTWKGPNRARVAFYVIANLRQRICIQSA